MTRPRAYQVNDPGTHHVSYRLPLHPSGTTMTLTGSNYSSFLSSTITGAVGGCEEPLPARIVDPTQEPFVAVAGEQFGVIMTGVFGENPMVVTLQAGDFVIIGGVSSLTASRLAARINAALATYGVSYAAATNVDGYLNVVSAQGSTRVVGADKTVTLTEVGFTPGILQKIGFGAVTSVSASGQDLTRGIVTKSADGYGGQAKMKYTDDSSVLTAPDYMVSVVQSGAVLMYPHVAGGQSIYAKLTSTPTPSAVLSFFSQGYCVPPVVSSGGDFSSLNVADTIRLQVSGEAPDGKVTSFNVLTNFNFVVNDVNDVVNAINSSWWSTSGSGQATATSLTPEPYLIESNDSLHIVIDGSITMDVPFTAYVGRTTAEAVASAINAQWTLIGQPGTVASAYTHGGHNYVKIVSPTVGGSASSVSIGPDFSAERTTMNKFGFVPGVVRGSNIASVYGASEISITLPFTFVDDFSSSLQIAILNQSGSAKEKMGLGTGTTYTTLRVAETPVTPIRHPSTNAGIYVFVPELLELGDVPAIEETSVQQFVDRGSVPKIEAYKGFVNASRPVLFDQDGRISKNVFDGVVVDVVSSKAVVLGANISSSPFLPRLNIPYARAAAPGLAYTLLSESIGIPATSPPATTLNTHAARQYAFSLTGGSNATGHMSTWNARWNSSSGQWMKDISGRAASIMSHSNTGEWGLQFRRSADNADWNSWTDLVAVFPDNSEGGPTLQLATGGWFSNAGSLGFSDNNIISGGAGEYVLLSSPTASVGDAVPRVADKDALSITNNYSIFRSLNARVNVTIGNGTTTFGDFNGTTALEDAVNYLILNSVTDAVIHVKDGTYKAAATINIGSMNLAIVGMPGENAAIVNPTAAGDTIVVTRATQNGSLWLKNILFNFDVSATYTNYSIVSNSGARIIAEDCYIKQIKFSSPSASYNPDCLLSMFRHCRLRNSGYSSMPVVSIVDAAAGDPIVFEDCDLYANKQSGPTPMVYIKAPNELTSAATFDGLRFVGCKFHLSVATMSGSNLAVNTGLIDLNPGSTGTPGRNDTRQSTGLTVKSIVFEDCTVVVNNPATGTNILLHLLPTANGTNAAASPSPFMHVDSLVFDRVSFDHNPPALGAPNAFTMAYGARSIVMRGCKYSLSSSSLSSVHGIPTQDVSYAIHGGLSNGGGGGLPTATWTGAAIYHPWGTISIMADDVTIDGFEATGLLHTSGSQVTWYEGDVFILYARSLLVRDAKCKDYASYAGAAAGSMPAYRWMFHNFGHASLIDGVTYTPTGLVDGLILSGKQASNAIGEWAMLAHIYLNAKGIHLTNSSVTGFRLSGGGYDGGSGVQAETRGDGLWDNPWYNTSCKITNSTFHGLEHGVRLDFFEGSAGAGEFEVSNNNISYCNEYGIRSRIDMLTRNGLISGNQISYCGKPGIGHFYKYATHCSLNIVDNLLNQNYASDPTGGTTFRQIHIYPRGTGAGFLNLVPAVFLDRNSCQFFYILFGYPGYIGITVTNGAGAAVAITSPGLIPGSAGILGRLYGAETGLNATPAQYLYTTDLQMTRNQAYLLNPSTAI